MSFSEAPNEDKVIMTTDDINVYNISHDYFNILQCSLHVQQRSQV